MQCLDFETDSNGSQQIKLCWNHPYHAQVQQQMVVGDRPWCDFVIFTKDVSVERIYFDNDYCLHTLLPKLEGFFDNCLGPEIVSPLHTLGIPMCIKWSSCFISSIPKCYCFVSLFCNLVHSASKNSTRASSAVLTKPSSAELGPASVVEGSSGRSITL